MEWFILGKGAYIRGHNGRDGCTNKVGGIDLPLLKRFRMGKVVHLEVKVGANLRANSRL